MYKTKRLSFSARARSGFSLVEMIGVLAIIAILAVIIVPKVFSTIASSRVTSAAASAISMKTSVTDFAGKYGTVPLAGAVPSARIDDLLFAAGLVEGRFVVKIGTQPPSPPVPGAVWTNAAGTWTAVAGATQALQSRIICVASTAALPNVANGANYQLDGATSLPLNARVVSAVIMQCTASEAQELSLKIDGASMSQATTATADAAGKVVYALPVAGLTNVYIYLAHQ